MGNWKDALKGLGAKESPKTTSPSSVTVGEVPERQYAEPAAQVPGVTNVIPSTRTVDEFEKSVLEWAAAALELIGKERLVAALDRALEGTNRSRTAFDNLIERSIETMPRAQAEAWRSRLPNLGGRKGCPTFCNEAREVLDAVTSGAAEQFGLEQRKLQLEADKLAWPDLEENESEYDYRFRLEAWAADKPERLLKAARFDAWSISNGAVERRELAQLEAATALWSEACQAFDQSGDLAALQAAQKAAGSTVLICGNRTSIDAGGQAARTRWAWPLVADGSLEPHAPTTPPLAEWLDQQSNLDQLIRWATKAYYPYGEGRDFRPAFRARLLQALPQRPTDGFVFVRGIIAIDNEGRPLRLATWSRGTNRDGEHRWEISNNDFLTDGLYPTTPAPQGWVTVRDIKRYGSTKTWATAYGPSAFKALQVARAVKPDCGGIDVRPWLGFFGRHPEKGFGRFLFRVQPGGAHWDQMIVSVDDRLRERIELLSHLPDSEDAPYADDIFYVPMKVVAKEKGGHGHWAEGNARAITYAQSSSGVQMSRRYSGGTIHHRESGSALAWTISAATNKHDHAMVIAVIGQGQQLHLDTGMAIGFDGSKTVEIPGGALPPSNDHSG